MKEPALRIGSPDGSDVDIMVGSPNQAGLSDEEYDVGLDDLHRAAATIGEGPSRLSELMLVLASSACAPLSGRFRFSEGTWGVV